MEQSLINARDYVAFTFVSTSHALKAEKVIKPTGIPHLMIPTPRQISASCGLAVKVWEQDLNEVSELFDKNSIKVETIYRINWIDGHSRAERIQDA